MNEIDENFFDEMSESTMPWMIGAVITKSSNKINLCPVTFQTISSRFEKPFSICIGLTNDNYTLETVLKTKEFTYAYPSKEQLKDVLYCGTVSGRDRDKLKNTDFQFSDSQHITLPQLKDAVANYECIVIHTHKLDIFTIVIGEIINGVVSKRDKLDKIYALGEEGYGIIKSIKALEEKRF